MSEVAFRYVESPAPIREDLALAHRRAWRRIAAPGTWWSGAERVAIAQEMRRAFECESCRARKKALTPGAVEGAHDRATALPEPVVDVVHRVTSDPARLSRAWFEKTLAAGVTDAQYVEAIGVLASALSIDAFHRALGVPLEPLPDPLPGEPSRRRPAEAQPDGAWVPTLAHDRLGSAEADLYGGGRTGNVIRALSLVPDEVRGLTDLLAAQYMRPQEMLRLESGRAIYRAQIELVAGRVSALNECFY